MSQESQVPNSTDETMMSTIEKEPEGVILYRNIVHETLQEILSTVNVDELAKVVKDLPWVKERNINKISNIAKKFILDNVERQVDDHINATDLCDRFSELKTLTKEYSSYTGQKLWRPNHDLTHNLRSHTMKQNMAFKEKLELMISKKEESVNKLKYEIIEAMNTEEMADKRVQKANKALEEINNKTDELIKCAEIIDNMESSLDESLTT